jgi:hypothetical protein
MMMIGQGVLSTNITFRTKRPVANFAPSAILSRNRETGIKCASIMDATKIVTVCSSDRYFRVKIDSYYVASGILY